MHKRILLTFGVLVLAGCATMNEEECRNADWTLIGFEDGSNGKSQSVIGDYRKDCAKTNVVPDLKAYQQGHAQGVRQYCVKNRGYQVGVSGVTYNNVCPPDLEPDFIAAYRLGLELYSIRRDINNLQHAVQQGQTDLDTCNQSISDQEKVLVSTNSTAEQRLQALSTMKDLQQQRDDLLAQVDSDGHRLKRLQRDAERMRLQHQSLGY